MGVIAGPDWGHIAPTESLLSTGMGWKGGKEWEGRIKKILARYQAEQVFAKQQTTLVCYTLQASRVRPEQDLDPMNNKPTLSLQTCCRGMAVSTWEYVWISKPSSVCANINTGLQMVWTRLRSGNAIWDGYRLSNSEKKNIFKITLTYNIFTYKFFTQSEPYVQI